MDIPIHGPVLLVCIYNKYGNILTHDYFYQMFGQYGQIVKILIFEKARVWKTFIQFTNTSSAKNAMISLNNRVVFQDGSKMNIFSSKLEHIKFQNCNLGGVNYQQLKSEEVQQPIVRGRRSTLQQHSNHIPESYTYNYHSASSYDTPHYNKSSGGQYQSTFSLADSKPTSHSQKSWNSFDVDQQFLQIARESQEFREMEKQVYNRKKSKTIVVNPNLEQFVIQNSPSKVLFARSLPQTYTNKFLYNIFSNFGTVLRVIFMKEKTSGLVQFETKEQAILAKDQLNYVKPQMKIFYSHYQSLTLREQQGQEDFEQYKSSKSKGNFSEKKNSNPPSQTLYLTLAVPTQQAQIRQKCEQLNCPIKDLEWRQNGKDKWMCLASFGSIDKSLLIMGYLQNTKLSNGKQLKISFTRSKIKKGAYKKGYADQMSSV